MLEAYESTFRRGIQAATPGAYATLIHDLKRVSPRMFDKMENSDAQKVLAAVSDV